MRIAVIGAGYVGLVSGACFSEFGMDVVCVDRDETKVALLKRGKMPFYEPGLAALVKSNAEAGRLSFTTALHGAVSESEAVLIAVGTPCYFSSKNFFYSNLKDVFHTAREVACALHGYTVVVIKSTVPVGTGRKVEAIIRATRPDTPIDVVSNPEFLREGSAINDFVRPDRVVVGTDSERAREVMRQLYRIFSLRETPLFFTNRETSELIKYAANAFLALKITFINEIADLCERIGTDVCDVAYGIGLDSRIGHKFLRPGPGYGGSCFPKDTLALVQTARDHGVPLRIVETVVASNDLRKKEMAGRIIAACGGSVLGKTLAVLGLTFKPDTDDMRESPSLEIIPALQQAGAAVRAFDPEGMKEARKLMPNILYCPNAYETMKGADALVILTEWNEFRLLDRARMRRLLKEGIVVDLRNIYDPYDVMQAGFQYTCLGRSGTGVTFPGSSPGVVSRSYVGIGDTRDSWTPRESARGVNLRQDHGICQLLDIVARLRDPNGGCPWDREQTFASTVPHTLEEAYEVADAIEKKDMTLLMEELGDLLLQVVLFAQMAKEKNLFSFSDIIASLTDKLVRRHPHVFGTMQVRTQVRTAEEQLVRWNALKEEEQHTQKCSSALDSIATALPAMTRAKKLSTLLERKGIENVSSLERLEKMNAQAMALRTSLTAAECMNEQLVENLGHILFTCVRLAYQLRIDPEIALRQAHTTFERLFRRLEEEQNSENCEETDKRLRTTMPPR